MYDMVTTSVSAWRHFRILQLSHFRQFSKFRWDTFTLEVPVVIRLTCDCAVADDAVMPIRAESSS